MVALLAFPTLAERAWERGYYYVTCYNTMGEKRWKRLETYSVQSLDHVLVLHEICLCMYVT